MIKFQLFILIAILFLSGKDALSYKLKSRIDNNLTIKRIQRFHRDGVILNILFVLPFLYFDFTNWWKYIIYTLIIRLSIFDLSFNHFAGLDYRLLGSTSWADQQFSKIFGEKGAVKKSLAFSILLITINIILR